MDALTFILGLCISETCLTGICPDNPEVGYVWQPYTSGYLYMLDKNTVRPIRRNQFPHMEEAVDAACEKVNP